MFSCNLAKRLLASVPVVLVCLCALNGCSRTDYKTDADQRVYKIIGEKWQDKFGSKVNYTIADVPETNAIQIEKTIPADGILTLPHAVAMATAHNREYQTQKETLYIYALDLRLARHDFQTRSFGGASFTHAGDAEDEIEDMETNVGFERLLAQGATITSNVTAAWVNVLRGDARSGLVVVLDAAVTQPLWRGSRRDIVMENLTQAERDCLYQIRAFNRFRKEFVVSVISRYYRVLELYRNVQNAEENCDRLVDIHEKAEKLAKLGRLPRFEVEQAAQDKLKARDIYVQAQRDYKQALDEFKNTLAVPTTSQFTLDVNALDSLAACGQSRPGFCEREAIETAMLGRLDLANAADAVADAARKITVAEDSLGGELNLVAGTQQVSSERTRRADLQRLQGTFQIGAELDLPFDRVAEQNILRKAQISLQQRWRDYEQAVDNVTLQVRQAYRDLAEAAERYQVQSQGCALAQKRLDNTLLLLQYARANTRDVLDAQNDLFDAQNTATQAIVDYAIAMLNFYRDTSVLSVRPDGMWQIAANRPAAPER